MAAVGGAGEIQVIADVIDIHVYGDVARAGDAGGSPWRAAASGPSG
jgi:hypothetical protein